MTQITASLPLFWSPPELRGDEPEYPAHTSAEVADDPFAVDGEPERFLSERGEQRAPRGHAFRNARPRARRMEGADQKTSVNDPEQYGITQEELDLIKMDLDEGKIDVNPSNILHAVEANNLRRLLAELGIDPTKRVSSTRDRLGMVRLSFVDLRRLMDQGFLVRQAQAA